jgi:hypothetical protein
MISKKLNYIRLEAIKIASDVAILKAQCDKQEITQEDAKSEAAYLKRRIDMFDLTLHMKEYDAFVKNIDWNACRTFVVNILHDQNKYTWKTN